MLPESNTESAFSVPTRNLLMKIENEMKNKESNTDLNSLTAIKTSSYSRRLLLNHIVLFSASVRAVEQPG